MVYCNRNCRGCHVDAPGTKNEVRVIDLAFFCAICSVYQGMVYNVQGCRKSGRYAVGCGCIVAQNVFIGRAMQYDTS